ncbi:HTH domain-containing protein [Leifsonia sp. SIMBA_070]|uniref:HTH domain-containing protein n=1 Tax=Leifsonia sp. SIMBA_070 TaxID=3085810 RepID=UPI00397B909C
MTVQAMDVGHELRRLVADGCISMGALAAITGIAPGRLQRLLDLQPGLSTAASEFSEDEIRRVSTLAGQLTWGAEIGDYERLRAIIETLSAQFELSHENIALLTRTSVEDVQSFLADPATAPWEFTFHFAVRAYYLFHAVLNAAPDGER